MRGQGILAMAIAATALAASPLAAAPAAAEPSYHNEHVSRQQQCARSRNNGTMAGALIGGIAGAVLGSQVSASGHRSDGSVLGGVVGAAAGAAIGRSSANANCSTAVQGSYDPYYGQPNNQYGGQYGRDDRYEQDPYYDGRGLEGGPYRDSSYGRNDPNCRWGEQIVRDPEGYEMRESVYMCRGRDGVWRAA